MHLPQYLMKQIIHLLILCFILTSCTSTTKKTIVVSQCSIDDWRNQMNQEILREAFFHTDMNVEIHSASDNSQQQIAMIESFIKRRVDLIIVAPNEAEPLRPVIEKAFDAGIPIILVDRKINSNKYTAFIGGDNVEVGKAAGLYIAELLNGKGNIIEIEGLDGSSSSQERHNGFHEVIDKYKNIKVVANFEADWLKDKAKQIMDTISISPDDVDLVFAYNDRMAIGAKEAAQTRYPQSKLAQIPYIGVDALRNDSIGIGRIEDGMLRASFLYQTGGAKAIDIADCILNNKPYNRNNIFQTSIVDKSNVHLMTIQTKHIDEQNNKIEFLNNKLNDFFRDYEAQRTILIAFVIITILTCSLLWVSIKAYRNSTRMNNQLAQQKERLEQQRDQLEAERDKLIELQATSATEPESNTMVNEENNMFMDRLKKVIDENMSNSDLSVEIIGAEMGLSRVQLYRRTKAACGLSPNETLRTQRLNKAYKLLHETQKTISEVAYEVGFSSPSYFAKCYKDYFGKNPTESLRN
ncbi:MAG: helix-turn-helix domain-containing protein [Bacteroidales bacterium]|nr:helix-turn-helix domain-containing protein [Bacteroidales bacterium]